MWRHAACRNGILLCALLLCAAGAARAVNQNVNLSETNTTTDTLTGLKCKPVGMIETNVGSDSVAAKKGVVLSETNTTTPAVAAAKGPVVGLTVTLTESDSCTATKLTCKPVGLIETQVTADSVSGAFRSISIGPAENLTTTASVLAATNRAPSPTETNTTTSAVTALSAHIATITDSRTTTDTCAASKALTCFPVGLIETHPTADAVSSGGHPNQLNLTEVVNESDSVTAVPSHTANLTETLTTTATLLVTKCGAIQDFLTTGDSLSVSRGAVANVTVTLSESDSVGRGPSRALTETQTLTDSLNAQKPGSFSVNLSAAATTVDTLSAIHAGFGNMTESNTTTSAVTAVHAVSIVMQEFGTTTDTLTRKLAVTKVFTESVPTNDQLSISGPGHISVSMTENLSTSATFSIFANYSRVPVETLSHSDAVTGLRGPGIAFTETNPTTDVLVAARLVQKVGNLSEFLTAGDTLAVVSPHAVGLTDSRSVVDFLNASRRRIRRRFVVTDSQ